ncbi:MAG: hypothetical protein R6U58_01165 [Bacteroidales bacterium]
MVFLFFLVVSAIFWFLSALGRQYTTSIEYPVRYTNFPENMVMVGELPSNLELTVNSHGYTLLRYYISRRLLPIIFDVNSFSLNRLPDTNTRNFYILSSVAANRISGQLGADIEILDIRPDTLFFSFTDMVSRKLPVKPVYDLQFERQFMIKGSIAVEPDTLIVSGPASVIDTMEFVPTRTLRLTGVNEPVRRDLDIPEIDMLDFSENSVSVTIPVEQFTEAGLKVPVEPLNLPDTLTMKTFPADITVSFMVALTDYDRVNPSQFLAVADYKSPAPGNGRLEVRLVRHPEFIRSPRFYPRTVDYIIETVEKDEIPEYESPENEEETNGVQENQ